MRRPGRAIVAVFGLLTIAALLSGPVSDHLNAARLLLSLDRGQPPTWGPLRARPVETREVDLPGVRGSTRARLYLPEGRQDAPGVVLLHGVHRLGIEEPRLVKFARGFAALGFVVLTPRLDALADWRVDASAVDGIAAAARKLRALTGRRVGVMGLSFAGGLALIAAARPAASNDLAWVCAVGAHDDLDRVLRFFATNEAPRSSGGVLTLPAHPYGAMVRAYSHPEDFFPETDRKNATHALEEWLADHWDVARRMAATLPSPTRERLEALFDEHMDRIRAVLLASAAAHPAEDAAVSPDPFLPKLSVPVLLLHGAADNVIPPSETEWLARGIPPRALDAVLISPLIAHVELAPNPTLGDRWRLVHFVARIFAHLRQE